MVKRNLWVSFLVMSLFLVSCEMIVDIDLPEAPDKLVVNCLFETGQPFEVHLSHSQNVLKEDTTYIIDGNVEIYGNGSYLGSLKYVGDGIYSNDLIIAQPETTYKLVTTAPGYDGVWAEDAAPAPSLIDTVYYDPTVLYNSEGSDYYRYQLKIWDDPETTDFYELICKQVFTNYISVERVRGDNEMVLNNEGDEDFYSGVSVFKDELIDTAPYLMRLKAQNKFWEGKTTFYLLTTSETMYKYRKSWIRHNYAQSPDILEQIEPVTLFSNINGGYGIFAGYSSSSIKIGDKWEQ